MTTKSNFELITLYKRLLRDGLMKFAEQVQEEIYIRMEQ